MYSSIMPQTQPFPPRLQQQHGRATMSTGTRSTIILQQNLSIKAGTTNLTVPIRRTCGRAI